MRRGRELRHANFGTAAGEEAERPDDKCPVAVSLFDCESLVARDDVTVSAFAAVAFVATTVVVVVVVAEGPDAVGTSPPLCAVSVGTVADDGTDDVTFDSFGPRDEGFFLDAVFDNFSCSEEACS